MSMMIFRWFDALHYTFTFSSLSILLASTLYWSYSSLLSVFVMLPVYMYSHLLEEQPNKRNITPTKCLCELGLSATFIVQI